MNVLTGYTKGTLSDNYLLSAAGGHIPLGNTSGYVPLSNNTLNKDLFADKARTLPYFTIPSSGDLSDPNDATKLIPKYIKIGTINIPLTSWYRGSIMLIFHDYEIYKLNGDILMIQCTTGGNKVGAIPTIRWKTKHDKSTKDSIIISKVDDNTYDLYFEAKFSWMTFYVYYLTKEEGVFNFNIGSWSLVKPNPITTRSTLLNVSSETLTLLPEYVSNLNNVTRDTFISGGFLATNTPYSNYFTGISLSNSELKYKYQFGFSSTGIPFVRYNNTTAWLPWKLLAFTSDISSLYLPLSGGIMTGHIQLTLGLSSIRNTSDMVLLAHSNSSSYSGVTDGTNTVVLGNTTYNTLIRSNNTNLLHHKAGTNHVILDADNYNTYTVKKVSGCTTTTNNYVKLGTLPNSNNSTYDSFVVQGSVGGFVSSTKSHIDISVSRRGGITYRGFLQHINTYDWDLGVNNAGEIFLILPGNYCAWSLSLHTIQGTIDYQTSATPTDTNWTLLSKSTSILKFSKDGVVEKSDSVGDYSASDLVFHKKYTSLSSLSANTSDWYKVATITDRSGAPCIFVIRTYAHSSAIFTVSKGYGDRGNITLLQYCDSTNADYAYITGARLLPGGSVEIKLRTPKTNSSPYVDISISMYNADNVKLNNTLTLSTSTLTPIDSKMFVDKAIVANTLQGNLDWSYLTGVPTSFAPSNHASSAVTSLSGYSKATSASDLATTDTLNAALGKLEYKSDYAYDWITNVTATDTDEYINKWVEIVGFLDSMKEGTDILDLFVTRKTDQSITGVKTFDKDIWFAAGNDDKYITFSSSTSPATAGTNSWRIGYIGSGDANNLVLQSNKGTTDTWDSALSISNVYQVATFAGNVVAPKFVTTNGTSSLFVKGDGSLDSNSYATVSSTLGKSSTNIPNGSIVKVTVPSDSHYLITLRGTQGQRCALLYVSGYGSGGTSARLTVRVVYSHANFEYYYNEESDSIGGIYVKNAFTGSAQNDTICVTSLNKSDIPTLTTVTTIPTGANKINSAECNLLTVDTADNYFVRNTGSLKNPNVLTIFGINYDGSVTQTITANTMISTLDEGTSDVTDNTEILTSYASDNGFADTNAPNTVYKRDAIKVYNYIKGKLDSVYQPKGSYLTSGSLIQDTKVDWGTTNNAGYVSVTGASLCDALRGNRFAGVKADAIRIEYSTDGGATWYDYETPTTDAERTNYGFKKQHFFTQFAQTFVLGKNTDKTTSNNGYRLRATVDCNVGLVYTELKKAIIYVSSNGASDCKVSVQTSNDNITYTERGLYGLVGWSGYNEIPLVGITADPYARGGNYARYIRFDFSEKYTAQASNNYGLHVMGIEVFGGVGWTLPNNHIARYGRPYTYDCAALVQFFNTVYPTYNLVTDLGLVNNRWRNVYASSFIGNVTGNVSGSATSVIDFGNGTSAIKIGYAGAALTTTEHFAAYSTTSDGTRCIKDISVASVKTVLNVPDNTTAHISAKAFGSDLRYIDKTTDLNTLSYGMYASYDNYDYTNGPKLNFGLMVMRINSGYTGLLAFGYGSSNLMYRSKSWNTDGGSTWKEWLTIAYMTDIPTKVSQLTNDNNYISLSGVTKLNSFYSQRPTTPDTQYVDNALRYYLATGLMTTNKPATDAYILQFSWDNSGYNSWLSIPCGSGSSRMQYRTTVGSSHSQIGSWVDVLDSNMLQTATAKTNLGWDNNTANKLIPTIGTLAFWTGAYNSSNNSNLQYCAYGEIVGTNRLQTATNITSTNFVDNYNTNIVIPTMGFISWWNGAWNSDNNSNLTYSANGTIIGSNNYTTYTVKKDGTGASGTWGINVTGSSGSCTGNAATATCIKKPGSPITALPTSTTTLTAGITMGIANSATTNKPTNTTYGNVIQIGGQGHAQLFMEWSGSSTPTTGKVYYNSKRDIESTAWGGWVQLIDERDVVTTSKAGLMSAADKTKLDSITGSVTNNLVIKLNNGTAEGTNLFTFNGSEAKTINITPASINALASNGTASAAVRLSSKGDNTNANTLCFYSASISSTTLSAMNSWTRPTDGSNNAMVLRMYKTANTGHDIYAASDKDSLWHRNSSNATSKWAKILDSENCYGVYQIMGNLSGWLIGYTKGKNILGITGWPPLSGTPKFPYLDAPEDTIFGESGKTYLITSNPIVVVATGMHYAYLFVGKLTSTRLNIYITGNPVDYIFNRGSFTTELIIWEL